MGKIRRWSNGLLNPGEQVKAAKCYSFVTLRSKRVSVFFFSHVIFLRFSFEFLQVFSLSRVCVYYICHYISKFFILINFLSLSFFTWLICQDCISLFRIAIQL